MINLQMMHPQQINHMMADDMLYLFQIGVLSIDNVYHVLHGIPHTDHIAKILSEKRTIQSVLYKTNLNL